MRTRTLLLAGLALGLPLMGGCFLLVGAAAGGAAGVVYYEGWVEDTLDDNVGNVHAAARAALVDLKLPVSDDHVDALTGRLESEFADGKHVWIQLESAGPSLTKARIRVGVIGDKDRAMDILTRIRAHLHR